MAEAVDQAAPPWAAHYPPSVPRDPAVPEITLPRMLDEAVARFPQAVALAFEGAELTYLQLRASINQCAMAMSRLEVRPGDRVAFVAPNCPQLIIGMYAAMRIGAVAVPLNPHASATELHHDLVETGADLVLCIDHALATVAEARRDTAVRVVVVTRLWDALSFRRRFRLALPVVGARGRRRDLSAGLKKLPERTVWLADILKTAGLFPPTVLTPPDAPAVTLFTAGGSGASQPVTLSHRSLVANAYQVAWCLPNARAGREVTLGLLPLFQVYGLTLALNATILLGGRLILVPSFDPDRVVAVLNDDAVTYFPAIPALLRSLLGRNDLRAGRTVHATFAVGSPLPVATADAFERMSAGRVAGGYGMTQTAGLTHAVPFEGHREPGSIGVPLPLTDVKIVDLTAARRIVRPGTVGELLVRGPQIRDLDLDSDGFFHTGDLVTMDAEGITQFVCRAEDAIRVGRQRVWPGMVEAPVRSIPQVARAAAVQGYSRSGGGVIKLYVEPLPGSHLDSGMITSVCETHLPAGLMPSEIEVRPSLPVMGTGEVLRRALRDERPVKATTPKENS